MTPKPVQLRSCRPAAQAALSPEPPRSCFADLHLVHITADARGRSASRGRCSYPGRLRPALGACQLACFLNNRGTVSRPACQLVEFEQESNSDSQSAVKESACLPVCCKSVVSAADDLGQEQWVFQRVHAIFGRQRLGLSSGEVVLLWRGCAALETTKSHPQAGSRPPEHGPKRSQVSVKHEVLMRKVPCEGLRVLTCACGLKGQACGLKGQASLAPIGANWRQLASMRG